MLNSPSYETEHENSGSFPVTSTSIISVSPGSRPLDASPLLTLMLISVGPNSNRIWAPFAPRQLSINEP